MEFHMLCSFFFSNYHEILKSGNGHKWFNYYVPLFHLCITFVACDLQNSYNFLSDLCKPRPAGIHYGKFIKHPKTVFMITPVKIHH